MPIRLRSAGLTDVGRKRTLNEDSFGAIEEHRLYIVADGMGGHNSGEIASKIAIETVANFFKATSIDEDITWPFKMNRKLSLPQNRLNVGIRLANLKIHETSRKNANYKGMGTTLVCLYADADTAHIAHVGDSRAYLLRKGDFRLLTEDHSLLNQTLKFRKLTPEEIQRFPHKNVIMRALGIREQVEVDLQTLRLEPGDRLLLCSDGLSSYVDEAAIRAAIAEGGDLTSTCQRLVAMANDNGGPDNITVILIEVEQGP